MEYEDPFEEIEDPEEIDVEPEQPPLWRRTLRRVLTVLIGLAVIAGLVYLSGFREFFFYRKTPQTLEAEKKESVLKEEEIVVPVSVRVMRTKQGTKGSNRKEEDIERLVTEANKIWNQADIKLQMRNFESVLMGEDNLKKFAESPREFTDKLDNFDPQVVNVFFIGNLKGPSGLAYMGSGNILVADYTTSHDFLVFAHEVGHVLGLEHTSSGLMSTGAEGADLSREQIIKARAEAQFFK